MNISILEARYLEYSKIPGDPRPGCLETGKFNTWQCCEFHKAKNKEDQTLTKEAITVTKRLFPKAHQDPEVPSMFWIGNEFMGVLSERWWELVKQHRN